MKGATASGWMSARQAVEMQRSTEKSRRRGLMGNQEVFIPSVRTAFRPLARHRPHRPVMAHPRRRHEDQTPFTVPLSDWAVEIPESCTHRPATTSTFPRHPPTAQTRPHPDHISIKFAHNAIRRLGYDGSNPANPNTQCTDSATSSPTSA